MYCRVGFDKRLIRLESDGTVGTGADRMERRWCLLELDGAETLEIIGDHGVTARLHPVSTDAQVWKGNWIVHEKMPIELQFLNDELGQRGKGAVLPASDANAGDLVLAVMTVAREPQYVHQTLASLFASDSECELSMVHVVCGSPEVSHLSGYCHHSRVRIYPMSRREWEPIRDWPATRRLCANYFRCLGIPLGSAHGICICEDDVIFTDRFLPKLRRAVRQMEAQNAAREYLLSCYCPHRLEDSATEFRCRDVCVYPAKSYYGTQCVYFPRSIVPTVQERIWRDGVESPRLEADMILRDLMLERNALYGTRHSLVQHVGSRTTGVGKFFHRSPAFDGAISPRASL
jgi:hypothetical protein